MDTSYTDTLYINELLQSVSAEDDEVAYCKLFEYFYPALCLYARRFIDEKQVREDIVQDVFVLVWENRKKISINTSARSYLMMAVKNYCLNYLRRLNYIEDYEHYQECVPVYSTDSDELFLFSELQELLEKALCKLPDDYRRVFELNRLEDKNCTEIAEEMNLSVRTVERYRNKASELLKKELKDYLPLFIPIII